MSTGRHEQLSRQTVSAGPTSGRDRAGKIRVISGGSATVLSRPILGGGARDYGAFETDDLMEIGRSALVQEIANLATETTGRRMRELAVTIEAKPQVRSLSHRLGGAWRVTAGPNGYQLWRLKWKTKQRTRH